MAATSQPPGASDTALGPRFLGENWKNRVRRLDEKSTTRVPIALFSVGGFQGPVWPCGHMADSCAPLHGVEAHTLPEEALSVLHMYVCIKPVCL